MIINAIMFFNELDALEIRLNELYDLVDYFVISESTKTHSGNPKPLYYGEAKNDDRFKKFLPKIIHQVVVDTPQNYSELRNDTENLLYNSVVDKVNKADWFPKNRPDYCAITWESESLLRALSFCSKDDIVILDEADELPRKSSLIDLLHNFDPNQIYNLRENFYYYYINCLKDEIWTGSTICTFETFKTLSLCENRMRRRGIFIEDAGWHFSYLGGIDKIKYKIQSHAEQDLNNSGILNSVATRVNNCLTIGVDIYNRPAKFTLVPIDESYPKYILENREKFRHLILEQE
jgi:beta-1,4-mannosyl-glycoprotein beta-1,4-N-acetylglucosaminyltransferase